MRTLGIGVFVAGWAVILWVGTEVFARQAGQREAMAELQTRAPRDTAAAEAAREAEADALASIDSQPVPPATSRPRPAAGSVVARIAVPEVGVDVVAHEGVDRATLKRGAGHFPSTALPGEPGNAAFAAHRDVEFRGLRRIRPGLDVYVDDGEATFVYRVADTRVVDPDEVQVLAGRGASDLTLITCYPFEWAGPAPRRFVVRAELRGRFEAEDRILDDALRAVGGRE